MTYLYLFLPILALVGAATVVAWSLMAIIELWIDRDWPPFILLPVCATVFSAEAALVVWGLVTWVVPEIFR